jgi:hypothetical protein
MAQGGQCSVVLFDRDATPGGAEIARRLAGVHQQSLGPPAASLAWSLDLANSARPNSEEAMTGNGDVLVAEQDRDRISIETVKLNSERVDALAAIGNDAITRFLTKV